MRRETRRARSLAASLACPQARGGQEVFLLDGGGRSPDRDPMRWKFVLRAAAAMIIGYGAIVCLTTFGFNVILGGRSLYGAAPLVIAAGLTVAVVAGLIGGYLAGRIGPARGIYNAMLVLVFVVIDTIYVLFFFQGSPAPFWFDAMGSATLIACTLVGGLLSERSRCPQAVVT